MPIAILYFLAAGAAGVGGPAASAFLFRRGQQEAAVHTQARDAESVARLLRTHIDLVTLRQRAQAVGVDIGSVEQGYRDLRNRLVTTDQVVARLHALGHR